MTDAIGSDLTDTTPPNDQAETKSTHTSSPDIWQTRYDLAYKNQLKMFKKWAEWYKMMYAIKTYKNIGVWRSKAFIPIMSYKAWSIISKILALEPGFSVKIYDKVYSQADTLKIQKANLKLQYDYDNPYLDETIRDRLFDSASDAVVCGTGYAKADWRTGTKKYFKKKYKEDGTPDYTKQEEIEIDYEYNDLDPLNAFDVFMSPGGRSVQRKAWIILKYRKTRAQLLENEYYNKDLVNAITPLGKQKDRVAQYKQARDRLIGNGTTDQESIDDTVDSFDLYECLEKTEEGVFITCFVEANKTDRKSLPKDAVTKPKTEGGGTDDNDNIWVRLRDEKQPYWHGLYPLIPYYIRRKAHQAFGESIFEVTESMANAYNDLFNQFADNIAIVGNGGILMHDTSTTIYDFFYAPGGEVRFSGNPPTFETPQSPDTNFFTIMMDFLEKGVEWGTISDYASGNPSSATDKTQGTASGIIKLQEAAGEIASFMKSNFMQSLKMTGTIWLSNNRQFLEDPLTLELKKGTSVQAMTITSEDFLHSMVVTIDEDSMQPATPGERLSKTAGWINQLFAIQNQSFIQAGIAPVAAGAQPIAPPTDPQTGQPSVKPMYLDLEAIATEVSNEYGKPDFDTFLHSSVVNEPQDIGLMVDAIRSQVDDGELEPDMAQAIIDQIEGRSNANAAEPAAAPPSADGNTVAAIDTSQPTA